MRRTDPQVLKKVTQVEQVSFKSKLRVVHFIFK